MGKDLVAVYEALLRRAQQALSLPDGAATRSRLYSLLLRKPIDARVQAVLDEFGLSASYVRTHLLSIGSWPADVKDAMRLGLPYQDARHLAGLELPQRHEVLQSFLHAVQEPGGTPTRTARWKSRALHHDTDARRLSVGADGWVPPAEKVLTDPPPIPPVGAFTSAEVAMGEEALPRRVLQGLLAAYVPAGGAVVDPMAGSGALALAAHGLGRWSWSGDRRPRFDFIHPIDAADRRALQQAVAARAGAVDLVLLHPPTATRAGDQWSHEGADAYVAWLEMLVGSARAIVRPDGRVAMVVRPWRHPDGVALVTDGVARALTTDGGRLVGYHVLVETRGLSEWHVLVADHPSMG